MPKVLVEKKYNFTGHRDCVYTLCNGLAPNLFFSSAGDGMVVQWDVNKPDLGEVIAKVESSVYSLCLLPIQNQLVIAENTLGLHFIDLSNKAQLKSLKLTDVNIFDLQLDNNSLFVACSDGVVFEIDVLTYQILNKWHLSSMSARTILVDGNELFVGYSDSIIRKIDRITNAVIEIKGHTNSVFSLASTPNKKYLISGGRDAHLKVWDRENNFELFKDIPAHLFAINNIVFSNDGLNFATCSMDKSIKVWDSVTFDLLRVIDKSRHAGHGTSINKLLWITFEDFLVSASDDRSISIWKLIFNEKNVK